MEKLILWAKTILSVYRYLERVSNAIDKIVNSKALNSFFVCGTGSVTNNILSLSEGILNLTERKVSLINLKLIVEQGLEKTPTNAARLLIMNYIEKNNCYDCSKNLGFSLRTYFRKMPLALKSFENSLLKQGYDEKYFDNLLKNEHWILEVKKNFETKKLENFEVDAKFEKLITSSHNRQTLSSLQSHKSLNF